MVKAIHFSGGKDSLACLYLHRNDPDVVVIYADTGSGFPGMREYVEQTVAALGMRLHIAVPETSCEQWTEKTGYPADIVPWKATPELRWCVKDNLPALIPLTTCCARNIWFPLMAATAKVGATEVIRGSKACDGKVGVADGFTDENGLVYRSPLWSWSDAEVFAYLAACGAELPPQYGEGRCTSLDCWCCTAHMDDDGVPRFAYLKDHHPDLYSRAKERLESVKGALASALASVCLEV